MSLHPEILSLQRLKDNLRDNELKRQNWDAVLESLWCWNIELKEEDQDKDLIDKRGLLDKWYKFEDERQKVALKKWCRENRIEFEGRINISSVSIRNSKSSDYKNILSVVLDWWNGRDLRGNVQRIFFDHFGDTVFVAEKNDELVGFLIGFLSQSNPDEAFIHLVGVRPDARKIGLGNLLFEHFINACAKHGRTVFSSCTSIENKDSIEFHKRIGFSIVPGDDVIEGIPVSYSYIDNNHPMVLFRREQ